MPWSAPARRRYAAVGNVDAPRSVVGVWLVRAAMPPLTVAVVVIVDLLLLLSFWPAAAACSVAPNTATPLTALGSNPVRLIPSTWKTIEFFAAS